MFWKVVLIFKESRSNTKILGTREWHEAIPTYRPNKY